MKCLIDINHPAHVHFFRFPIRLLQENGHQVLVTSREKEHAVQLLNDHGIEHTPLSSEARGGLIGLGSELVRRDYALFKFVKNHKPDVMAAIGGTFIAHVGLLSGTPSLVYYDTENAKLQNAITYPFASKVIVPRCYAAWVPKRHLRYPGYHELSYLHPSRFTPDPNVALENGLDPEQPNFFIRTVSWKANHDVFESGWSLSLLGNLVKQLSQRGKVHISAETGLPSELAAYAYQGKVSQAHHLMAHCRLFVGESATMASECAVLGVPAIYAASTGRGYTDEQQSRYGLVLNLRELDWEALKGAVDTMLAEPPETYRQRRQKLLSDTVDVADMVAGQLEQAAMGRF